MMDALAPRDRRTLLAGFAVIASLLAVSYGMPPYRAWRSAALGDAEREAGVLARVEGSVERFDRTGRALAKARAELAELDSIVLNGATTSAAGTSLAAAISDAAEGAEAQLGSIQVRGDSAGRKPLTRIAARASVSGDAESLALFLESLEAGFPLLAVREWSIGGGSTSMAPGQRTVLRMDVLVEGLALTSVGASSR